MILNTDNSKNISSTIWVTYKKYVWLPLASKTDKYHTIWAIPLGGTPRVSMGYDGGQVVYLMINVYIQLSS